jgi:hypothetical protein
VNALVVLTLFVSIFSYTTKGIDECKVVKLAILNLRAAIKNSNPRMTDQGFEKGLEVLKRSGYTGVYLGTLMHSFAFQMWHFLERF